MPDFAAIADTGREKQSTWDYLRDVIQPALPFQIVIVPKLEFGTVDLWGGADGKTLLIPAYTTATESGKPGKLTNFCSNEWKVRVVERYLRRRGVGAFQSWIGFSVNEVLRYTRLRKSRGDTVHFPLVDDVPTTAEQAVAMVEKMGWPKPHHSSCFICPNMSDPEWLSLPPNELESACVTDDEIRLTDPDVYLHKSCKPLRQVKFEAKKEAARPCDQGVCFV